MSEFKYDIESDMFTCYFLYQLGDDSHRYRDATEKLFLHTIYSSTKHISILYLVPFCVK